MNTLIMVTLGITLICNLIAGLGSYLILYTDIFQGRRIQKRRYTSGIFWRRFPLIAFNISVLLILSTLGLYLTYPLFDLEPPSLLAGGAQLLFLVLLDDAYFYFFHRTLHETPSLYKRIHKIHHHAFAPFPLEYIYVHPLEWMFGGVAIPVGLAIIYGLTGSISAYAFWIFAFWRNIHEVDIHSGLRSSLAKRIPFFGTTEHHDQHHLKNSKGNYASTFTYWDRLLGTALTKK